MLPSASASSSVFVHRDDLDDPAPAFACIVTAAVLLGTLNPNEPDGLRRLVRLGEVVDVTSERVRALRAMADGVGLALCRPPVEQRTTTSRPPWNDDSVGDRPLWLVRYKATFANPEGRPHRHFTRSHYGLVMQVADGAVVVADPHPWRAPVDVVPTQTFVDAWRAAAGGRKPWAARLARARRGVSAEICTHCGYAHPSPGTHEKSPHHAST